ncbi:MAG: TRAP transporter substrate-binding protein [Synergistaceae bacterium]|jgi:tripartite ATP-independent transporter DctP family solute receptor|nr:TRAP transporter substrate-binding protein [Synergistaceae bacterium]
MKWKVFVAVLMVSVLSVLATPALAAPEYTLKLGHLSNEEHSWHKASLKFAEEVERLSGGRIVCQVFANEQLGNEVDTIQAIHTGIAHMVITGESMQNWAPKCALIAVPYMIRDMDHLTKVLTSDIGKEIEKDIIDKVKLRPVSSFVRAPRNLTSNRPVTKPDELNGFKIRIPNVPLFVKVWEAFGAKPTPMAFSEVFTSLQQHVIDGQENPLDLIRSGSLYEVQKYVDLTEHVYGWIYLVIGEDFFQKLPEDLQKAVVDAGKTAETYERELFLADVAANEQFLKEKGMEFVTVDKAAFATLAGPAVEEFLGTKPADVLELYKKIVETK